MCYFFASLLESVAALDASAGPFAASPGTAVGAGVAVGAVGVVVGVVAETGLVGTAGGGGVLGLLLQPASAAPTKVKTIIVDFTGHALPRLRKTKNPHCHLIPLEWNCNYNDMVMTVT